MNTNNYYQSTKAVLLVLACYTVSADLLSRWCKVVCLGTDRLFKFELNALLSVQSDASLCKAAIMCKYTDSVEVKCSFQLAISNHDQINFILLA